MLEDFSEHLKAFFEPTDIFLDSKEQWLVCGKISWCWLRRKNNIWGTDLEVRKSFYSDNRSVEDFSKASRGLSCLPSAQLSEDFLSFGQRRQEIFGCADWDIRRVVWDIGRSLRAWTWTLEIIWQSSLTQLTVNWDVRKIFGALIGTSGDR